MEQTITEMAKDLTLALLEAELLLPGDVQRQLAKTHAGLLELKAREDNPREGKVESEVQIESTSPAPPDWKKSIKKYAIECLICGQSLKQLSARHLRRHDLDARTYRQRFGIPRTQALSAKETTAMRRHIVQQSRPWEKAPTYLKTHEPPPPPTLNPSTTQAREKKGSTIKPVIAARTPTVIALA